MARRVGPRRLLQMSLLLAAAVALLLALTGALSPAFAATSPIGPAATWSATR